MKKNLLAYEGGIVGTNAYLILGPEGNLLIDAPEGVVHWLDEQGKAVDALLLTHQHFDHVEGVADVVEHFGCEVLAWAPPSEQLIRQEVARSMGLPVHVPEYQVDRLLEGVESIEMVGLSLTLAHLPGHSPDSVVAYCAEHAWVATGDTLMAGSIGRSDLPGGDHQQLLQGIVSKLYSLPSESTILPGHGPMSTLAREAATNPWVRPV